MPTHNPAFLALVEDAKQRIRTIDAQSLPAALAENADSVLIDVREESEYAAGRVRGAEHLGKGVIERDIETLHPNKAQPIYLYCGGGYRSILAADALSCMGYGNVVSVDGGWRALRQLLPIEGGLQAR